MNNTTIGERIKRMREKKNYTQEYVASELGISQNTYSKVETGGIKLTTDRLNRIASLFDVPVEQILSGEKQSFEFNNSTIEKFYGYIETLQDGNKELVQILSEQIKYLQGENEKLLSTIEKLAKIN